MSIYAVIHSDIQLFPSQEVAVTEEEDSQANASAEVAELEERIAELGRNLEGLGRRVTRLEGQKEMLEKYSNGMFAAGETSESADLVNQKTVGEGCDYLYFAVYCLLEMPMDSAKIFTVRVSSCVHLDIIGFPPLPLSPLPPPPLPLPPSSPPPCQMVSSLTWRPTRRRCYH